MKKIAKILSIGLSALMLISTSSLAASAASVKTYKNAAVISSSGNCDLSKLNQLCKNGKCDINSIMEMLKNCKTCPDGICDTKPSQNNTVSKPQTNTPSAQPAKPSNSSDKEFNTAYEDEVIRLVNAERAKYGLSALKKDDGAVSAAHIRAKEIVQSFSHTRPNGTSCFTAAKEIGVSYKTAGENIAYGYATPQQVVNGWMNSEGHRKNILSSSFSKIGVGCYSKGNVLYWSQFFIG